MIRFTFRQLEYFVAVGEAGSISMASEKVNVSSPSISAAISHLEKEFGLPLFVRQHAQGLSLTSAGRRMMDEARLILAAGESMSDLASDLSGSIRGPLSIGCLLTFAQMVLPAIRRSFVQTHPEVRITQHELNQAEVFSALRRAEIDVALTYDLDVPTDLRFVPLLQLPTFVVVNEDHPLADADELTVEALAGHEMILLDLPVSADYFLSCFAGTGIRPVIAERTRDMAVMRSLVANGFGYSIASVRPFSDRSPDGKPLKFIPLRGGVRDMRMGLLMSREGSGTSVQRAFAAHCRDMTRAGGLPGFSAGWAVEVDDDDTTGQA